MDTCFCKFYYIKVAFFLFIAPSSPPRNVVGTGQSSTTILVSWSEVPAIDHNGIITQYEVEYEPLETFGGQITTRISTVSDNIFELLLNNLEEYVVYNISVRAYTGAGVGVTSSPVSVQTDEYSE